MGTWREAEIEDLKAYYSRNDTPSDQILKDRDALEAFTLGFNDMSSSDEEFSPEEVADQLLRLRKNGRLPRVRR